MFYSKCGVQSMFWYQWVIVIIVFFGLYVVVFVVFGDFFMLGVSQVQDIGESGLEVGLG